MLEIFKKQKKTPKNLKEVLAFLKKVEQNQENLSKEIKEMKEQSLFSVQKVGIVRFNPFKQVGGDQSFSLALLDAENNGIVITSLYTRAGNRVYGKPIKNGKSEYSLSEEEKEAIKRAKNRENEKRNTPDGEKQLKNQAPGSSGAGAR